MQPVISKGLNELVLIVKDVSLSRRFYSEVVGLSLDSDASPGDDEWTWFTTGEPGHARRIALHKGELRPLAEIARDIVRRLARLDDERAPA